MLPLQKDSNTDLCRNTSSGLMIIKVFSCSTQLSMKFQCCINFILLFTTQSLLLTTLKKKPFENIIGKGENASNAFSTFPIMFSTNPKNNYCF